MWCGSFCSHSKAYTCFNLKSGGGGWGVRCYCDSFSFHICLGCLINRCGKISRSASCAANLHLAWVFLGHRKSSIWHKVSDVRPSHRMQFFLKLIAQSIQFIREASYAATVRFSVTGTIKPSPDMIT